MTEEFKKWILQHDKRPSRAALAYFWLSAFAQEVSDETDKTPVRTVAESNAALLSAYKKKVRDFGLEDD